MKCKSEKVVKILFAFALVVACFSIDNVMADCKYQFVDHNNNSGTLTATFNGKKLNVKFSGSGSHFCSDDCDEVSEKVFVIENGVLYCPQRAFFCYDGQANSVVSSASQCKENPATMILNGVSGGSIEYKIPSDNENSVVICSAGGTAEAEEYDKNIKSYEAKVASYTNNLPTNYSELNTLISEIEESGVNDYIKYCNQSAFESKNIDARVEKLEKSLQNISEQMYKKGTIDDNEYSGLLSAVGSAFSEAILTVSDREYSCEGLLDKDLQLVIRYALTTLQIAVPILLIILVTVDFASVVISQDNDAMKKVVSKTIKRTIAAIVIFFIPMIVKLVLSWAHITDSCGL